MITNFLGRKRELRVAAADFRYRFRIWRGVRPFWAALFTFMAGLPILYWPYAHLDLNGIPLALSTTSGAGSLVIGLLFMVLGFGLCYRPALRVFAGIATLLLALISFPVANFGGLFLGLFSGLIGGSLACSWMPPVSAEPSATTTESLSSVDAAAESRRDI
ncbi:DUF6114 domain-containing protein [Streptomyces sp. NPDC005209]|uniref:DUF6114 domain-containing protein n=1 Tax=Streptomyces sp. NPDC005209 TaxID=3156715 RepID=UPI0033AD8C91